MSQLLPLQTVMIDEFLIDVALSEEHTFESEVTEYPVEKGADITDNIRPKPIQITMEGLVSNSAFNPLIVNARTSIDQSVDDAYAKLMKIRDERETVTIRTSLRTYQDMAMKNLVIPRLPGQSDALKFTATFVQVEIVSNTRSTRVATPIANKSKTVARPPDPNDPPGGPLRKIVTVSRTPGTFGLYLFKTDLWYDVDINGWREQVVPSSGGGIWVSKGKPFGASDAQWATVKTDAFWKAIIAQSSELNKGSPLGDPYNPFDTINVNVVQDVRLVHTILWSRTPGEIPVAHGLR